MDATELIVFLFFFALVTVLGFVAAHWQRGDLSLLDEWGLAGRRFGTIVSWFLIGGDLYTAYTFIAVPALVFGAGATGFFAVPYTIIVYPFIFVVIPRLWAVAKKHGYITGADFIRGRYGSHGLALALAVTGILATMPYIALQLVGMQAVLQAMGLAGSTGLMKDLPLIIAFAILALYTYTSGLRAPALVAVVKDLMIYITILAAIIVIPAKLGGFGHIFKAADDALNGATLLAPKGYAPYATLALGSALALFFYPHAVTAVLSTKNERVLKRNAVLLPLYTLLLGFIALLGYMARAAQVDVQGNNQMAVPLLFAQVFPHWFAGFAYAAIVIGALVPAAIMSIAAANLFTRNIYKEYFRPGCTPQEEAQVAKLVSLIVKVGALVFVVGIPLTFAINLQLLGGIWILQTVPMLVVGLYTKWFHRTALLIGWAVGMVLGTYLAWANAFKSSIYAVAGVGGYIGIWALLVNLAVVIVLSLVFHAIGLSNGKDETSPADYVPSGVSA